MGEALLKDRFLRGQFTGEFLRVEVVGQGVKTAFGQRRAEFGIISNGPFFEIIHLPSGLSFRQAGMFRQQIDAMRAVVEIDRLRNDWRVVDMDDFVALNKPICAICAKNFGRPVVGGPQELAAVNTHNGYDGKLPE